MFNYLSVFGYKDRILPHSHSILQVLDAGALLYDRAQPDIEGDRAEESGEKTFALDLGFLGLGTIHTSTSELHEAQVLGPTRLFAQLTLQERIFSLEDTRTRVS